MNCTDHGLQVQQFALFMSTAPTVFILSFLHPFQGGKEARQEFSLHKFPPPHTLSFLFINLLQQKHL